MKEKSGYSEEEFQKLKELLLEGIITVPKELTKRHMKEAIRIMENIDKKDSVFIARAFAVNADGILSFDKDFIKQKRIRVFAVKDLI